MTISEDMRWRALVLYYVYAQSPNAVARVLGISRASVMNIRKLFDEKGIVMETTRSILSVNWPSEVIDWVKDYTVENPCFYLEEIQNDMRVQFFTRYPSLPMSIPTICRALKHVLKISRKVLEKRAREATAIARDEYFSNLSQWYMFPGQLVFVDETSKDGRDGYRRYARSYVGTKAIVKQKFTRGNRISAIAACTIEGFIGHGTTEGTFNRGSFHENFIEHVIPHLRPWPMPNSIVIMDNAKIHCYTELHDLIHMTGAILIYLPPYSPELNPIENLFGLLKRYIQRHFKDLLGLEPNSVFKAAMLKCTEGVAVRNILVYRLWLWGRISY
jgi:hypothetical protein